ncbi:hypothetical protein Tco_0639542 [Tanacetum coccineum]
MLPTSPSPPAIRFTHTVHSEPNTPTPPSNQSIPSTQSKPPALGVFIGQPKKKKKAKKDLFTIYFHYDGIFICSPLEYTQGHMKELNDTNFHDMSYDHLKEIALRLVPHGCFEKLYYCQTGVKLNLGLTELRSNQDIGDMLKVGYENGNAIDMYVEHFGYDIMEMAQADRNEEQNQNSIESSDDDYNSSDCEEIENVDFR